MNCPSCHRECSADAAFCAGCGQRLSVICASCGRTNPQDASFCEGCGIGLTQATTRAPERDPRSYTPKHLTDKILQSRSALEGERKQVTVLFADVKGSMELAEQVDPEEWHRILDRFFQILTEGVHRFEGTVNQYTGDGIMALFGAPITHEDHAQRACWAALWLRDELRAYADGLRLERGLNFAVRIGLNSGEVVVGKIGDDLRMDYTAQGQTVGLAARVEQIAAPDSVYLSEHTRRLVEGFFELRDLGRSKIKGVSESLRLYELADIGQVRTRLDASRLRGFSRFVGRDDEMTGLELALNRAMEGNGQVVGVVGEAGVGKSRLCLEFVERCRAREIRVLAAHCPAHGKTVPLLPILELLRSSFGITEQDRDQAAREKIAGRLLLLDRAFDDLLPLVFDFLGVPDPAHPAARMDPEARQRQLYGFVRRLVQARSEREPAVLLFDDIQWIDSGSDAFLTQLVEATSGTRTMLLVNFRPEYQAGWIGKSHYQQLPLSPLGPESIDELLRELLGKDPTLVGLYDLIRERTGGNPFFIEEVVQSLAESGSLQGTHGSYHLAQPMEELRIPATVQVVLAARIDRLAEIEKRVLHTASVIGKQFSEALLRRVAGLPEADLAAAISALRDLELIREQALYPEVEYAFKHPLTQEVAYGSQLQDQRRRLHAAVARAIEAVVPEKLDEQAALLAHHCGAAGEHLEAARWHRRAAQRAGVGYAQGSVQHWRKVREVLDRVDDGPEAEELRLEACLGTLGHYHRVGMSAEEVEAVFHEGRSLAQASRNLISLARLINLKAQAFVHQGQVEGMFESMQEAVRVADESGDADARFGAREGVVWERFMVAGQPGQALAFANAALAEFPSYPDLGRDFVGFAVYAYLRNLRGCALALLGDLGRAGNEIDEALELARRSGDEEVVVWNLCGRGLVDRLYGDYGVALGRGVSSLRIADKTGSTTDRIVASLWAGSAYRLNGCWSDAVATLDEALRLSRSLQLNRNFEPWLVAELAEAALGVGDADRARALVAEAVQLARQRHNAWQEILARLAQGRVLLVIEGLRARDRIEGSLARAQDLVDEAGIRGEEPFIYEARAELARLGDEKVARDHHLHKAHRLYTEMGATGHAERLARELNL